LQRHIERVRAFARNRDDDGGAGLAAHTAHGVIECEADDAFAVDGGEIIARLDAGASGRRIVDRRDDAHDAFFAGYFDAEAAIFAAGLRLHFAIVGGVHIRGVRIK
jgi:hypothetical protein